MQQRFFLWINGALAAAIASLALFFLLLLGMNHTNLVQPPVVKSSSAVPKFGFQLPEPAYNQIKDPLLSLEFSEPNLSLPDIRTSITYYGTNKRPDAGKNQKMYFSIGENSKTITAINMGEKTYLVKNPTGNTFQLSPKNEPTALWILAKPSGKNAIVEVYLKGVNDSIIREPKDRAYFTIPEKPSQLQVNSGWMLGPNRVDGTLLIKQKAKWYGRDLFLELYGGSEFMNFQGKQRLNFGEGEDQYAVFADVGDILIWKENRWQIPAQAEKTQEYPLLEIKNISERILGTELWDVDGKFKIPLNMIRMPSAMPNFDLNSFQFLGARTKIHYMFNVDGRREIVGTGDWFIFVDGKWQKIRKSKDIDAIAEMQLVAPLLILDRFNDQGNKSIIGKLFNASHSEMVEVEIPLIPERLMPEEEMEQPESNQESS